MTQRHAVGNDLHHPPVTEVDQQDPLGIRVAGPAARQQLRARHRPHRLITDDQRHLLTRIAQRTQPLQRRRRGGLAHHPVVGVKATLEVADQNLHGGRVLIDDEEDRLGDWLGHGKTSRRRRTRRPSPDCTVRWQNSCPISLRRHLPRPATGPATPYYPHRCERSEHGPPLVPAAARDPLRCQPTPSPSPGSSPYPLPIPPTTGQAASATRRRPGAEALRNHARKFAGERASPAGTGHHSSLGLARLTLAL